MSGISGLRCCNKLIASSRDEDKYRCAGGSQGLIYYFEKRQLHIFWCCTLTLNLLLTSKEIIAYFVKSLVVPSSI